MFQSIEKPVIGIDASLNSLGYAYYKDGSLVTGTVKPKGLSGSERLNYHQVEIARIFSELNNPFLMVLENYSMGSPGKANNNAFKVGELGGLLKLLAWQMYNDVLLVPPKTLKLFVAGNGNADKYTMARAIRKDYGIGFGNRDDESDAFGLLQFGMVRFSRRKPRCEHKRRALLKGELIKGRELF